MPFFDFPAKKREKSELCDKKDRFESHEGTNEGSCIVNYYQISA